MSTAPDARGVSARAVPRLRLPVDVLEAGCLALGAALASGAIVEIFIPVDVPEAFLAA